MDGLARILLQMDAHDPDFEAFTVFQIDRDPALAHDGVGELADLIALGQVGIEIVLPVKHRTQIDLGFETQPGAHGLPDRGLVEDRQHAGHGRVDKD